MNSNSTLFKTAAIIMLLCFLSPLQAQLNYTDDFSTNTSATYTTTTGPIANGWNAFVSGADWGVRRNVSPNERLEITNDAGATANAIGSLFAFTAARHHPYLNQNTTVTWNFNMRQSTADPGGFTAGAYGVAYVLAGQNNTTGTTGNGYAVVLGTAGTTDPVRLVRFTGGLQGQTTMVTSNTAGLTDFGNEYLSVRVVYTAATNTWELFLRNDGLTAFADPTTGVLVSQGTRVDPTYTASPTTLCLMGGYFQGNTAANQTAFFDNTSVVATTPAFVTTWIPGGVSTNLIIPTTGAGYSYNVFCQDMSSPTTLVAPLVGQTGNATCTPLVSTRTYRVFITGTFPRIFFQGLAAEAPKIRTIDNWGTIAWTSMVSAFQSCVNLTYNTTNIPNLSGVTDLTQMFRGCTVFNGAIGSWNTSTITSMNGMFRDAQAFNQPIGTWNTAAVTNMSFMFNGATAFNQAIGPWNTAAVINMSSMFRGATAFNQAIGTWSTAAVTGMSNMFNGAIAFNQPIGTWNTAAVTNMGGMFQNATAFNQAIGTWNTTAVTDMGNMFNSAIAFNQAIGTWNTAAVSIMGATFQNATAFNQPIGTWNTAAVSFMAAMFQNATAFNQPIGTWNTAAVTSMSLMFSGATAFNQPIGTWNTAAVISMAGMLDNCGMSINNYDYTIIGWAANPSLPNGITLGALNLEYCNAEADRLNLISLKGWTFSGDSKFCLYPEINVVGNAISIIDGDITPSTTDHTDFGPVVIPTNFNRVFTIQNTGPDPLTLTSIALSGPDAGDFSISGLPAFPIIIAGGGTQNLTVTFTPSTGVLKNATITINSDDFDESVYDFAIMGLGLSNYITIANGNWNLSSTWLAGAIPASDGNVIIAHTTDLNTNYNTGAFTLTIQNNKSLNIKNTRNLTVDAGGTINNNGILISNVGGNLVNNGTLANSGILNNWETFTNNTTFNNLGIVNNTKNANNPVGATLNNSGIFNNNTGGVLTNNGLFDNPWGIYNNNFGATLNGAGTYNGYLANDGTFAPGNSPGVFTINGIFINNGIIEIEIGGDNGAGDPNGHDRIVVNGDVFLDGEVRVSLINAFLPGNGSEYNFITGTTVSNIFSTTTLPGTGWTVPYTGTTANARYDESLPIELLSFDAVRESIHRVQLTWATASEINNQGFYIERMLQNEPEYTSIGWVNGNGTTTNTSYYNLIDENGFEGVSYYRLKQIDFDGTVTYSNIKAVSGWRLNGDLVDVFPNPIHDHISIRLTSNTKEVVLRILDAKGALIRSQVKVVPADKLIQLNDLNDLAEGIYMLTITTDDGSVYSKKLLKKQP